MNYRSFADLAATVSRELWRVPSDIDLVVGIPRSGLFAAWYVALLLNRRVVDLVSFLQGNTGGNGHTRPVKAVDGHDSPPRKILLVDDCVASAGSMARAVRQVRDRYGNSEVVTLAVFVAPEKARSVDIVMEVCRHPQLFEWNIFHCWAVERSHFDMDGVLCVDPTTSEDDDGPNYLNFIRNAKPLISPTGRIRKIVTGRLEKYREPTEEWLERNGISYGELIMLDMPTAAERNKSGIAPTYKAQAYKADPAADLFVESNSWEAKNIARAAGKHVFDFSVRCMIDPNPLTVSYYPQATRKFVRRARRKLLREFRAISGRS